MKLYYSPGACSLAPHIAFYEAGLAFKVEKVSLRDHTYAGGDYYKVNPKGSVPAIEMDNGQILTEAAVVLQYIADQKPEKNLLPKAGTLERYRTQEWLNYVATEMHKGFSPLWYPTTSEDTKEIIKKSLSKRFEFLANHFKNNSFLMGNQFTVADAYLFTILNWTHPLKVDLSPYPGLMGFMERVKNRPAVQAAMKAEGILK